MRFDANGAAAVKRDSRDIKLLPMHHMLLPQDKVHYLQVSCRLSGQPHDPPPSLSVSRMFVFCGLFSLGRPQVLPFRSASSPSLPSITCLLLHFPGPYLPENVA